MTTKPKATDLDFTEGDIICVVEYDRVDKVHNTLGSAVGLTVTNLSNNSAMTLHGPTLLSTYASCSAYDEEQVLPATELAHVFTEVGHLPFTVVFEKANGEKRTLRGRYISHERLLGRSMVHDFDVTSGSPVRLVDHRTLYSLIVGNVKYVLKTK